MSFGLPPVKPKPSAAGKFEIQEGHYGVPDPMVYGLAATKEKLVPSHPLEESESNYAANELRMSMQMMQNLQGLQGPLKFAMELRAARRVGHLPFLPSSNLMYDTLTGRDDRIGFEDILNIEEFREEMAQPHLLLEKLWDK
ncbi:proteasome maturation protein [Schistocerca piceifrons]|uniref:proteasome maturation protein n=1 Tax=Schistocerca piceifrons TaxID=274613 RepID=UPI001F5EEAAD|nr:proteasome maturation protein [Schistocerca piceifrons]